MQKVRWGVLGAAKIAIEKVIPAMQLGSLSEIAAIGSRDLGRARQAADALGIPKAYGSYEELLNDPGVEAIYNPLPNHLHVPWSIGAMEHGKHVLCEKPIGLNASDAQRLIAVRDRTGVKVGEAFMVRTHPQWIAALDIIASGRIGAVQSSVGCFSYFNEDAANIRNIHAYGGGALMDIGCYLVKTSRLLFRAEPRRVLGLIERDPRFDTDRLTSIVLDFGSGHAIGTCGTQMVPYQRVQILGTRGRVEIEIPFNAPPDRPCRIFVDDGKDLAGRTAERIEFPVCDQYTIQGDLFSRAIRENTDVPCPLEEALLNMSVIDALFRSAESGRWETPGV